MLAVGEVLWNGYVWTGMHPAKCLGECIRSRIEEVGDRIHIQKETEAV